MQTGVFVKSRQPDETSQDLPLSESEELEHCVSELIKAFDSRDIKKVAEHIKVIHDVLHEYMDKPESKNDFDSQNQKAAKDQE